MQKPPNIPKFGDWGAAEKNRFSVMFDEVTKTKLGKKGISGTSSSANAMEGSNNEAIGNVDQTSNPVAARTEVSVNTDHAALPVASPKSPGASEITFPEPRRFGKGKSSSGKDSPLQKVDSFPKEEKAKAAQRKGAAQRQQQRSNDVPRSYSEAETKKESAQTAGNQQMEIRVQQQQQTTQPSAQTALPNFFVAPTPKFGNFGDVSDPKFSEIFVLRAQAKISQTGKKPAPPPAPLLNMDDELREAEEFVRIESASSSGQLPSPHSPYVVSPRAPLSAPRTDSRADLDGSRRDDSIARTSSELHTSTRFVRKFQNSTENATALLDIASREIGPASRRSDACQPSLGGGISRSATTEDNGGGNSLGQDEENRVALRPKAEGGLEREERSEREEGEGESSSTSQSSLAMVVSSRIKVPLYAPAEPVRLPAFGQWGPDSAGFSELFDSLSKQKKDGFAPPPPRKKIVQVRDYDSDSDDEEKKKKRGGQPNCNMCSIQ